MPQLTEIAPGVLIATSSFAQTNTTVIAGERGSLVIDPGVHVDEMAGLAAELDRQGLRPVVAWATHPHWDHVLWCAALGDAPRYAAPAAAHAAQTERDGMLAELDRSAPGHDLSLAGAVTPLAGDSIEWAGPEVALITHDAHAPGHGAVFLPGTGVFVVGDMLSDVEVPLLDPAAPDPLGDYRTALRRLGAVAGVRQVVPGHGHVGDAAEFRRRLAADSGYLDQVTRGEPFDDARLTEDWMRAVHDSQIGYFRR